MGQVEAAGRRRGREQRDRASNSCRKRSWARATKVQAHGWFCFKAPRSSGSLKTYCGAPCFFVSLLDVLAHSKASSNRFFPRGSSLEFPSQILLRTVFFSAAPRSSCPLKIILRSLVFFSEAPCSSSPLKKHLRTVFFSGTPRSSSPLKNLLRSTVFFSEASGSSSRLKKLFRTVFFF